MTSVNLEQLRRDAKAINVRYKNKLLVNKDLTRSLVSFQASKKTASYRWYKFKEAYSSSLVEYSLVQTGVKNGHILDPFAGSGTTNFAASSLGLSSIGIEVLPIGKEIIEVRKIILDSDKARLVKLLDNWMTEKPWKRYKSRSKLNILRITEGAYPPETEQVIENYLEAIKTESSANSRILRFALLCILESISYTRKDGQYLRWDYRAKKGNRKTQFNKGVVKDFDTALTAKLNEMIEDISGERKNLLDIIETPEKRLHGTIKIFDGSCLDLLKTLKSGAFDALMTSPPYCNRYDYTRTYALELAILGVGESTLRTLRQTMMSCTVENRDKEGLNKSFSKMIYKKANDAFDSHKELQNILAYLEVKKSEKTLNNPGISRMVKNYFYEMCLIIFESARALKKGAPFIMVNDNVRYAGADIPVDLILSDFAQAAGMEVEVIWVLPRGKGNSSQQMGVHGRTELRKSVYVWRKL